MSVGMAGKAGVEMGAGLVAGGGVAVGASATTRYRVECFSKDGERKWVEEFDNLVVTSGLNELIDKTFKGSAYTAAWYVGLTDASPTFAAGDTMASHVGWAEVADYDEATREALTLGSVANGSANNSASPAEFTINGSVTVGGAFITNDPTKSGTSGTLYGGGAFSTDRVLQGNDLLRVTVTPSVAAS